GDACHSGPTEWVENRLAGPRECLDERLYGLRWHLGVVAMHPVRWRRLTKIKALGQHVCWGGRNGRDGPRKKAGSHWVFDRVGFGMLPNRGDELRSLSLECTSNVPG